MKKHEIERTHFSMLLVGGVMCQLSSSFQDVPSDLKDMLVMDILFLSNNGPTSG